MADRAPGTAGVYLAILRSRLRSQQVYRTSFALDVASSLFFGLIEFAELWILFHQVPAIGGLNLTQMTLLFGLSHTAFASSQVLVGHVDSIPTYLRAGTLDTFYLRPLSVLGQLVTSEVALRRIGWLAVGLAALGYALLANPIAWSLATAVLLVLTLVSGAAIFAALFVAAAGAQFFLIDGEETTNAFTYGGRYASQQPSSILPQPLLLLFTGLVPVVFVGYLPALAILGLEVPAGTPWLHASWAWVSPLVAAGIWLLALAFWRTGVRHYQGGGG